MSNVLLVEDDTRLRRALHAVFRTAGFSVLETPTGEDALALLASDQPDLVILDLRLPGLTGQQTLQSLRTFSRVPVIVLTVVDTISEKLAVLNAGADDYLVKPVDPEELVARADAQLRRSQTRTYENASVRVGQLEIDLVRRTFTWAGEPIRMTPTELRVVETLLANRGGLVTREELAQAVWGESEAPNYAALRIAIGRLRRKLHDDAAHPALILTELGLGYRWVATGE